MVKFKVIADFSDQRVAAYSRGWLFNKFVSRVGACAREAAYSRRAPNRSITVIQLCSVILR